MDYLKGLIYYSVLGKSCFVFSRTDLPLEVDEIEYIEKRVKGQGTYFFTAITVNGRKVNYEYNRSTKRFNATPYTWELLPSKVVKAARACPGLTVEQGKQILEKHLISNDFGAALDNSFAEINGEAKLLLTTQLVEWGQVRGINNKEEVFERFSGESLRQGHTKEEIIEKFLETKGCTVPELLNTEFSSKEQYSPEDQEIAKELFHMKLTEKLIKNIFFR